MQWERSFEKHFAKIIKQELNFIKTGREYCQAVFSLNVLETKMYATETTAMRMVKNK